MDEKSLAIAEAVMDANKERIMEERKAHFKIIADLFATGTADISTDARWVAMVNKPKGFDENNPRMTLEKYMNCFPDDINQALSAAENYRQELTNDGINRKSYAYYCLMGCAPECISKLFNDVYKNIDDRRKAWRRFFREFPAFKVTTRSV